MSWLRTFEISIWRRESQEVTSFQLPVEVKQKEVLCSWEPRQDGNSTKLHQWRVRLGNGKHFLIVRMVRHRNRLPREVVGATWLLAFKRHLDNAHSNVL